MSRTTTFDTNTNNGSEERRRPRLDTLDEEEQILPQDSNLINE